MVAACTGPQVITDEIPMQGDMESLQLKIGSIFTLRGIGGARKKSSRSKQVRTPARILQRHTSRTCPELLTTSLGRIAHVPHLWLPSHSLSRDRVQRCTPWRQQSAHRQLRTEHVHSYVNGHGKAHGKAHSDTLVCLLL